MSTTTTTLVALATVEHAGNQLQLQIGYPADLAPFPHAIEDYLSDTLDRIAPWADLVSVDRYNVAEA